MGFSLASPDLVICAESPEIPPQKYGDSPEVLEDKFHQKIEEPMDVSLENGINEYETNNHNVNTPSVKFSTFCETFKAELSPEVSFELPPPPIREDETMCDLNNLEDSVQASPLSECHTPKVNNFLNFMWFDFVKQDDEKNGSYCFFCRNDFIAGYG